MKRVTIAFALATFLAVSCSDATPGEGTSVRPVTGAADRRIDVYEAMIRRLADADGSQPIYVFTDLCSMLASGPDVPCPDRLSPAEQQELVVRLNDVGRVSFRGENDPALTGRFQEILLGPIIEEPDGLRVEGGSVCGGDCGSGAMYIVVPTDTGYQVAGTDASYGEWIS